MLSLKDMYRMRLVGDVRVSPDGEKVAFVVARMNRKKDTYLSQIYLHDGKLRKFTAGEHDTNPRFTPDGRYLIYYRSKKEGGEIRRISLSGGESELVAEVKNGASDLKVDGKYVYFISSEEKKEDVKHITRIPFYFNGEGFIYNSLPQIYRVPLAGGKIEKLTDEKGIISAYDVRDGKILFAMSDDEKEPFMEYLYLFDGREARKISERKASIGSFRISPDGSRNAVFLKFNTRGMAEDMRLHFLSMEGGDYQLACEEGVALGKSLNSDARFGGGNVMQWLNDNEILFIATRRGRQEIMIYTDGRFHTFLGGERSVESFAFASGALAFVAQHINRPGEVYVKRANERRITNFNRKFAELPEPEHFTFRASDGEEIDGWILMPEGNKKHPAVLEIHGGPKTSYGHAFMFEFYYLLSQGFSVIFTNPRGSSGYGEDFALHIRGEFGKRDYEDLMEAVDFVLKTYPIDPDRLYVTGGSYGGFMTNWIVGHTSRFRAAVTQRSISNQLSFWGTSDIGPWFNGDYIGAGRDLWDAFDEYWEMSPLKYAKNVKTPLLIIHSEEDYRCPVSEAYQLFYALKMRSIDTKMVLFPGENHDLSRSGKPKHREARLKEIAEWFKTH